MLEDRCHILDLKLAAMPGISDKRLQKDDFDQFVKTQNTVRDLENSAQRYQEKIDLVFAALSTAIINDPQNEANIQQIYKPRLEFLHNKMQEKVK